MKAGVDMELFLGSLAAFGTAALGLTAWLTRRQDRLETSTTKGLGDLHTKLDHLAEQTASRHDTGLGDIWQALEDHRIESRRSAAEADRRSSSFREDTLRQLGQIAAVLARLEARLPPDPPRTGV